MENVCLSVFVGGGSCLCLFKGYDWWRKVIKTRTRKGNNKQIARISFANSLPSSFHFLQLNCGIILLQTTNQQNIYYKYLLIVSAFGTRHILHSTHQHTEIHTTHPSPPIQARLSFIFPFIFLPLPKLLIFIRNYFATNIDSTAEKRHAQYKFYKEWFCRFFWFFFFSFSIYIPYHTLTFVSIHMNMLVFLVIAIFTTTKPWLDSVRNFVSLDIHFIRRMWRLWRFFFHLWNSMRVDNDCVAFLASVLCTLFIAFNIRYCICILWIYI